MNISVNKNDIIRVGHTAYEENGNTVFVCDIKTANVEEILLRNILLCFGDYEIVETEDVYPNVLDDSEVVIEFTTDLPWEAFLSVA